MKSSHFGNYKYYRIERYRDYYTENHNQYDRGIHYRIDMDPQFTKKKKEIEVSVSKRALMFEKASDEISSLPKIPPVLWKIIAEYEGGVELSLLGEEGSEEESSISNFCPFCIIL